MSSNGLLLKKRGPSVLPYVDDLGLPLGGHNVEINLILQPFCTQNEFKNL